MLKHILTILSGLTLTVSAMGQKETKWPGYRLYATQQRQQQLKTSGRVITESMAGIERFTTAFRQTGIADTTTVALVFHLMPLPDGQAITPADLQAQVDRLNVDFFTPEHPYLSPEYQDAAPPTDAAGRGSNTQTDRQVYLHESDRKEGFAARAGLPMIRFCLAVTGPDGSPASGVIQPSVMPRVWSISDSLCLSRLGGSDGWSPERYCNVWVARLSDSYAGFAQMPGGPGETDGIVIDDRFFARAGYDPENPYRLGKTLSHLAGSYLNLYELWNEYQPCADDYVDDTPIHNGSNFGLPDYRYRHVSLCDGNPVEMITNLMDNSTDTLQYLFTRGQVLRMQAALAAGGPRGNLRNTPVYCPEATTTAAGDPAGQQGNGNFNGKGEWMLRAFPNPSSGRFMLEIQTVTEDNVEIRIINTLGKILYRQSASLATGTTRLEIDATGWSAGIYTVSMAAKDRLLTQKIFIEK